MHYDKLMSLKHECETGNGFSVNVFGFGSFSILHLQVLGTELIEGFLLSMN